MLFEEETKEVLRKRGGLIFKYTVGNEEGEIEGEKEDEIEGFEVGLIEGDFEEIGENEEG